MRSLYFFAFCSFFLSISIFAEDKKRDFLMGSIVKSDLWEIDRKNNIEYFKKNVSFRNDRFFFKSDNAIYDHNNKKWNAYGNVYAKDNIEKNSFIEVFCGKANYNENNEEVFMESFPDKNKFIYYNDNKYPYTAYSYKAIANNFSKEILFTGAFELHTSSISAYSDNAFYREIDKTFELTSSPYLTGSNHSYNFKITGEKIKIFKDERKAYITDNIYGVISSEKKE
ncbi:MAG: hypothetical protein K6357_04375 [Elusimicrobiota bacterium]